MGMVGISEAVDRASRLEPGQPEGFIEALTGRPMLHDFTAVLAAVLVGLAKGGLPAIGMLAVPVLALTISPIKAATLLLRIYMATDIVAVYLYRRSCRSQNLAILIPAGVVGVLLGWWTAADFSDRAVAALISALGVGYCLSTWSRRKPRASANRPSMPLGLVMGTLSGWRGVGA